VWVRNTVPRGSTALVAALSTSRRSPLAWCTTRTVTPVAAPDQPARTDCGSSASVKVSVTTSPVSALPTVAPPLATFTAAPDGPVPSTMTPTLEVAPTLPAPSVPRIRTVLAPADPLTVSSALR
jgi:hypothetical protein